MSELDEDKVHDLLHGVDHEEPGQDQDLRHWKPGVGERALCYGRGGDLNRIWISMSMSRKYLCKHEITIELIRLKEIYKEGETGFSTISKFQI